ncbi:MAG: hypothetical protein ACJATK_002968 [Paracoccaceae bacterium]|jgi:hypothetical protein
MVKIGNANSCPAMPIKNARGAERKKAKLEGFKPSATENIMVAKDSARPISDPCPSSRAKSSIRGGSSIQIPLLAAPLAERYLSRT